MVAAECPGRPGSREESRPRRRVISVGADAELEGVAGRVPDVGLGQGVVFLDRTGTVIQALALDKEVFL